MDRNFVLAIVIIVAGCAVASWGIFSMADDSINLKRANNYLSFAGTELERMIVRMNCDDFQNLVTKDWFEIRSDRTSYTVQQKFVECFATGDGRTYEYSTRDFTWKRIWFSHCDIRINSHKETYESVICVNFPNSIKKIDSIAAIINKTNAIENQKMQDIQKYEYYPEISYKYRELESVQENGKICWYQSVPVYDLNEGVTVYKDKTSGIITHYKKVLVDCGWLPK